MLLVTIPAVQHSMRTLYYEYKYTHLGDLVVSDCSLRPKSKLGVGWGRHSVFCFCLTSFHVILGSSPMHGQEERRDL